MLLYFIVTLTHQSETLTPKAMTTTNENYKLYWVGMDDCGIIVATLDIHGIKGLTEVHTIEATNVFQAKVNYVSFMNSEGQASSYFESL